VYRPGDRLWAELPLRGGKEKLVWSYGRSQYYQLDRLQNQPRRQGAMATSPDEGQLLVEGDVRISFRPEVPTVPELMPWVRLPE
jgi:hypothetical protein